MREKEGKDRETEQEQGDDSEPQVYAVQKDLTGWRFNRREFLAATGAATAALAGAAIGCGSTSEPTATPAPTKTRIPRPTNMPTPTDTSTPTSTPMPTPAPTATLGPVPAPDEEWVSAEGERSASCQEVRAHTDTIWVTFISKDGSTVLSASSDEATKLWSLPEGALISTLDGARWAQFLDLGTGESIVASVGEFGNDARELSLWSAADGEPIDTISGDLPAAAAERPEGTLLALEGFDSSTIDLYWWKNLAYIDTLDAFESGDVYNLAISPDGNLLAAANSESLVKVWSLPDGELLAALEGHANPVWHLLFTPDSGHLVTGGAEELAMLWSLPDGELVTWFDPHVPLSISPSGKYLLTKSMVENSVGVWSLPDGELVTELPGGDGSVEITPDETLLVTGDEASDTLTLWSLPDGEAVATLMGGASPLALSSDGRLLVSLDQDQGWGIKLWSLPDGALEAELEGHNGAIRSLAITPDRMLLISGDELGVIKLWRLPQGLFAGCLMDLAANDSDVDGVTYEVETESGETVQYTIPCGAPVPPGSVCVCNCVGGSYVPPCSCVGHCSCDSVCSCVGHCSCDSHSSGGHYWYPC